MNGMWGKKRFQIIGLGVLALVTTILVIWSLPQVRNPAAQAVPAEPATALPPLPESPTAGSSPSPAASAGKPTATKSPAPTGLAGLSALLKGKADASILVLGDGSGNETDEWVSLWATDYLAADHKVTYRSWDPDRSTYRSTGTTGSGTALAVWNASITGPNLRSEDDRVADVWQAADVVILNYGHRNTAEAIGPRLTAIHKAVKAQDPNANVLVMIQNPDPVATEQTQKETTEAVKKWADDANLDSVNIYDAFIADPAPRYQLVEADGSPTPVGSALWAKTLAGTIAAA